MGHMKYFPNADMIVVKDAGHTMFGEKPEECIEIIENTSMKNNGHDKIQ